MRKKAEYVTINIVKSIFLLIPLGAIEKQSQDSCVLVAWRHKPELEIRISYEKDV